MPKKCLLTLTLWTWMVFPQSSRYCFRSLSCNTIKHHYHLWVYSFEYFWVCVCVWVCVTRYSKTSVRDFCVWMMSWSVTILACFRSFSRDTEKKKRDVNVLLTYNQQWLLFNWVFFFTVNINDALQGESEQQKQKGQTISATNRIVTQTSNKKKIYNYNIH